MQRVIITVWVQRGPDVEEVMLYVTHSKFELFAFGVSDGHYVSEAHARVEIGD